MTSQSPKKPPRVVIVGSVAADSLTTYLDPFDANGKNRVAAGNTDIVMGGGAGNAAQALARINKACMGQSVEIAIITELGKPVAGLSTDELSHQVVSRQLTEQNIECIDIARGECAVAFNTVVEHSDGRMIFVQNIAAFPKDIKPDAEQIIEEGLKDADYILLGSSKPQIAVIAARAAKKLGVTIVTDWDNNVWPTDPAASDINDEILRLSDIILVPTDTVVKGMANKIENPDELFARLQDQYGAENILMSNGGSDVRVLADGLEYSIPVQKHQGNLYALAAGDHRNAMLLHSLAQGDDVLRAFRTATAFASVKIKYPRFEWTKHTYEIYRQPALTGNDNAMAPCLCPCTLEA
ncbi:MAG TPA: carbohydrate kinase family protein [Alphaproteobacteria bacterium]|nr:carbohydrate kinase family protein [Alphaproteobacteria bacterium]